MKLKKIASLALAGVMAVSMLAGCANKPGTTDDEGTKVEVTTTAVADAMNAAGTKITFTEDAELTNVLKSAVEKYGSTSISSKIASLVQEVIRQIGVGGELKDLGNALAYDATTAFEADSTGKTETILTVKAYAASSYANSQVLVLAKAANDMKDQYEAMNLADDDAKGQAPGATYYKFSYTGKTGMVTVTDPDTGVVTYLVITAVTRTCTADTL